MEQDGKRLLGTIKRCVYENPVSEDELVEAVILLSVLSRFGYKPQDVTSAFLRERPELAARLEEE